jgi:RNA polymerase sigma-70 factor (ECF subfamily)
MSAAMELVSLAPAALPATPRPRKMVRPASAGAHDGRAAGGLLLAGQATSEESDEALATMTAAGDQRAFREIVRRHGGRMRALALRFAGGRAEADDIVQDAFLSFWRTASRWKPGGPPLSAYLTRIAVNRAIDGDRRRRVRHFFGIEEASDTADPEPAADERLENRRALEAVARDIAALPARQRAAILLAAEGERSNAEIAAALNLSEGAVEQLLVRARRTLRARIAEREGLAETG